MSHDLTCSPFPLCCGIKIIHGFLDDELDEVGLSKNELKRTERIIQDYISKKGTGVYLVALNEFQKKAYHDLMVKLEFQEIVKDSYNPNSGNIVSLYGIAVIGDNMVPEMMPQKLSHSIFQRFGDEHIKWS